MRTNNKKYLKGTWCNYELEYTFDDKSVSFQFLNSKDTYSGFYNLSYNNLKLTYKRYDTEPYLKWEAVIERLDNEKLVLIDISNEIGRREVFTKKVEIKSEISKNYTKSENSLSVVSFVLIILFVFSLISDVWIFGYSVLEQILGFAIIPSIFYLRDSYKKIPWVKETIDDFYKLLKDIVTNGSVQKLFVMSIFLFFALGIIVPIIQLIIIWFNKWN